MREIKFRVWCKDKNEWEKDVCLLSQHGDLFHVTQNMIMPYKRKNHIIQMFTGLLDKNGVEVYEGDILIPNNREVRYGAYDGDYSQGCGFFTICHNKKYSTIPFSFSYRQAEDSEVIGNIYEHRHLLEANS
jgi:uncharacterized phage protein (TIGR01671 family)